MGKEQWVPGTQYFVKDVSQEQTVYNCYLRAHFQEPGCMHWNPSSIHKLCDLGPVIPSLGFHIC